MRISDWSSDVCSSDLVHAGHRHRIMADDEVSRVGLRHHRVEQVAEAFDIGVVQGRVDFVQDADRRGVRQEQSERSEEHTSELQSLMSISYAVFCLKKTIPKQKLLKSR